jgi:isoquinoline 1-oxidoreductase beta subunit
MKAARRDETGLSRRDFLRTSAWAGAGLVLGFHLPVRDATAQATAASFKPNAWLQVEPSGAVRIWVGKSEMGQGIRTSLPMLVAEELECDWSKVTMVQASPGPDFKRMSTGGSHSVRGQWDALRKAGAAARQMLVAAAARFWAVEPGACRAENGEVLHPASGRKLGYGALVADAAKLTPPAEPALKDPKAFRLLGRRIARLDVPEKVDGSAGFGLDVRVPGMLVAMVARCPTFGGKVKSHDPAPALAVRGVRKVVAVPAGIAVIAESTWAARRGVEELRVEWDRGPLAGLNEAAIWKRFEERSRAAGASARKEGQGAAAIARAKRTLEAAYRVPYQAHAPMEPPNCTVHLRAGECEVWAPTQVANDAHETAARVAGLPQEKVTVHVTLLGGGFGRRLEVDDVEEAVEIAKSAGAPVKVMWTREDELKHGFYRPATYHVLRAGLDGAGKLVAWTHRIVGPNILARVAPEAVKDGVDPTTVEGARNLPYAVPNLEVDCVQEDPGVPVGFWRSVGSSQNAFVVECFLDEVATAAKRDPVELRRELLAGHPRHRGVLDLAAEKAGWGSPLPRGRGRGVAVHESFGSFVAQVAEVTAGADGQVKVDRVVCAVDCGMHVNPDTIEAQMEGSVAFGLTAALKSGIRIDRGGVAQSNFHDYELLRLPEMPRVEVHIVPSDARPGGIGEPGVPPVAPAVANAIFAATGKRVRTLPVNWTELRKS